MLSGHLLIGFGNVPVPLPIYPKVIHMNIKGSFSLGKKFVMDWCKFSMLFRRKKDIRQLVIACQKVTRAATETVKPSLFQTHGISEKDCLAEYGEKLIKEQKSSCRYFSKPIHQNAGMKFHLGKKSTSVIMTHSKQSSLLLFKKDSSPIYFSPGLYSRVLLTLQIEKLVHSSTAIKRVNQSLEDINIDHGNETSTSLIDSGFLEHVIQSLVGRKWTNFTVSALKGENIPEARPAEHIVGVIPHFTVTMISPISPKLGDSIFKNKGIHNRRDSPDEKAFSSSNGRDIFEKERKVCMHPHTEDVDSLNCEEIILKTFEEKESGIKLYLPRNFNPSDSVQRLFSFQGCESTGVSNEDLASAGFYHIQNGRVTCFSCLTIHHINDFIHGDPFDPQWHETSCKHVREQRSIRHQTKRLESDGRVSDDISDPPGQQSIYIPPGDINREAYRLSTFEHFPVSCSISRKNLAKSGFFFTGYHDRVKCFACARTVQQWVETDNPADFQWHKPTCPLPKGEECGNVPLPSLFGGILPVAPPPSATRSSTSSGRHAVPHEEVLEQRDPTTGAIVRRVRYPSDLPERIRQTGGTFEIGPDNQIIIRSGPGPAPRNPAHVGLAAARNPAHAGLGTAARPPMRQWRMANVVSADHKRFLTNLYLNRELDRLASFARWPVGRPNIAPAYLAKSGFFYLGDMDRTQCFSCGGVLRNWKLEDDADAEHRAHFPQCPMMLGTEDRNVSVQEYPETEEERYRKYPCRFPSNPHMRSENSRVSTFDQRWPMRRTAATPAEIAQAGFFFLGERDRAKCWYCNGGLQNWEYDDIPWIEHAKWFPNCQFLLRVKGQHFVYRHLAVNPHLARPIIARQDGSPLENIGQPVHGSQAQPPRMQDTPPSSTRVNQPEPTPIIIDPQVEMRRCKEKVEDLLKNSEIVKFVISMGFDSKTVAAVLEDRISLSGGTNQNEVYESASDLLDDVNKKDEELKREEQERQNQTSALSTSSLSPANSTGATSPMASITSGAAGMASLSLAPGLGKYNVLYDDDDEESGQDLYGSMEPTSASLTPAKQLHEEENNSESLRKALEAINEEKLCKICFSNQADMVFVPCSHLCCCMDCTQAITQCPICRKPIQKAIKTYLN